MRVSQGHLVFFSLVAASVAAIRLEKRATVPAFVRQFAPVVFLDSTEAYLPSSIAAQVANTHPEDFAGRNISTPAPLTLANLNSLDTFGSNGSNVTLTSDQGIRALPSWFNGAKPNANGSLPGNTTATAVVTVSKPNNILDAFFFFFYAYNRGDWIFGLPVLELGDHVGDWEHVMVRFQNSTPQAMWYSQHSSGQAFTFSTVQKFNNGSRPIVYSANGTHANYAIPGPHPLNITGLNLGTGLPIPPVTDQTSRGIFWDPLDNAFFYQFDNSTQQFTAYNGIDPTGWLNFNGIWGDLQLPINTPGQVDLLGQIKYVSGPTGPKFKGLGRVNVCNTATNGSCPILTSLSAA
ncbi:uncharacterized protein Z520_00499 [Fonsecaea multimorphosa CBS 102226]|uniref:Vacuolar protein sorting-associated protein 62 n=1 Tax=Fonsecaea multimorphosa CBS 102226 TaxID=1442371 RepID=A0A0D2KCC7_9EURO|nr:uncharacterized protein Z520_00499 [Fonsecaea multimorphosa CBS 102226]KIY03808.1 hypothetical protein Z520_00499 [Fonsecaea multimorphosa CBS 102226]OAL32500.1 hypothetical protein AYO22_00522 [Fonsecaea multimorphosa]